MSTSASMTMDGGTAAMLTNVRKSVKRNATIAIGGIAVALVYLIYSWFALEVPSLIASAQPQRAVLLATDMVAHKVHITKMMRQGHLTVSVEGERTAKYETPPEWVEIQGNEIARVDLGGGYKASIDGKVARFTVPDYGTIVATVTKQGIVAEVPEGPHPEWLRVTKHKVEARPTIGRRIQVTKAKIEIHRYFLGWENFFFPFRSELNAYTFTGLAGLAMSDDRLKPEMSNAAYIFDTFWRNPDWQHDQVFIALLETMLMAVLGTLTAAFVGLPLAILAARNFTPSQGLRFITRRLFDFLRGIDMLIWSLIFIRAFGLGPLTGALAIAFTDTGTLGKLFSEALENIDRKQLEGVSATGASKLQTYRFGVIPHILPIFISQGLYYLESNTRSATVIGALGAGGIGLLLVETLRTHRDWENTLYIIVLTIVLVMVMDSFSGWLRRKLIHGSEQR